VVAFMVLSLFYCTFYVVSGIRLISNESLIDVFKSAFLVEFSV
jgi:hypothetical protein